MDWSGACASGPGATLDAEWLATPRRAWFGVYLDWFPAGGYLGSRRAPRNAEWICLGPDDGLLPPAGGTTAWESIGYEFALEPARYAYPDVARAAGVSRALVSLVFRNQPNVREASTLIVGGAIQRDYFMVQAVILVLAALYGLLGFGLSYAFLYYALVGLAAGTTSLVMASVPLMALVLAVLHGQERLTARGITGGLLAMAGIALLSTGDGGGELRPAYFLAAVAGAAAAAESSVVAKGLPRLDPVMTNAIGMTAGSALLWVASLATGEAWALPVATRTWVVLGYLVLLGSVSLFILFLYVIRRWTASATAYALAAMPVVAVTLGSLLADEAITPRVVAGGGLDVDVVEDAAPQELAVGDARERDVVLGRDRDAVLFDDVLEPERLEFVGRIDRDAFLGIELVLVLAEQAAIQSDHVHGLQADAGVDRVDHEPRGQHGVRRPARGPAQRPEDRRAEGERQDDRHDRPAQVPEADDAHREGHRHAQEREGQEGREPDQRFGHRSST